MAGRRHPREEITAKLAQADELAAEGKSQREITRALGISVMTYHRWRKSRGKSAGSKGELAHGMVGTPAFASETSGERTHRATARSPFEELQAENLRLRRLVTDLLLEKVKLEEELRERDEARFRHYR